MGFEERLRGRWNSLQLREEPEESAPAEDQEPRFPNRIDGTFIGSGALFEGTLSLKGDFCIDNEFHGALETDGVITVGPSGSVQGDIRAREVIVEGAVVGDISARRQLILRASARLHGNVETACFEIERHAFFQGGTKMTIPYTAPRTAASEETGATAFSSQ